jgi:predicted flap endonuclease-1-like 5' DNA nuclease
MAWPHHPCYKRKAVLSETNNLKLIDGIGPDVENRLHRVGIFTFTQLANLSPADIAAAIAGLAGLSAGRIVSRTGLDRHAS